MPPPARLTGLCVLVIEDDYYIADDTRQALEDAGADVLGPFSDAEEAMAAARRRTPDCAVLDVNLGSGPSFSPARSLLADSVPVVFVTGYDSEVVPADLGASGVLQKPVSALRLVCAVAAACRPA
jgi:DNA-binding response OmpR family regulator